VRYVGGALVNADHRDGRVDGDSGFLNVSVQQQDSESAVADQIDYGRAYSVYL